MNTQNEQNDKLEGEDILHAKVRQSIINLLNENVMEVTFTKKDGTERVMKCTLSPMLLPTEVKETNTNEVTEGKKPRKKNLEVVACYDLEAEGWRSFRLDSLKDFKVVTEEFSNPYEG